MTFEENIVVTHEMEFHNRATMVIAIRRYNFKDKVPKDLNER